MSETGGDTTSDSRLDTGSESGDESDSDSATDTTPDTAADTSEETGEETGGETGIDTGGCTALPLCDGGGCALDVDLHTARLSGVLRLDGADLAAADGWSLQFVGDSATWDWWSDPESFRPHGNYGAGEAADIASIEVSGGVWSGVVPVGTWDVYLARGLTERVPVVTDLVVATDATLDVDAVRHAVTLSVALDGVAIPQPSSGTYAWTLILTDDTTHARREVDAFATSSAVVRLAPGTWSATLDLTRDDLGFAEGDWSLGSFDVSSDTSVALDTPGITVGGALSWDGEAPWDWYSGDSSEMWEVILTDVAGGGSWSTDFEEGATWATQVPPGTYDVTFRGGSDRPRAASAVDLTADATLDIAIDFHDWSGEATYDGAPPPRGVNWMISFADTVTGESFTGRTDGGLWTISVPDGVYDVYVTGISGGYPSGGARVAQDVVVAADGTLDVSLDDHAVSGTLSFDGGAPPDPTGSSDWGLAFVDTETGAAFTEGYASDTTWSSRLPAGVWDVWMWWDDGSGDEPYTRLAAGVVIVGDTTLDLAVELSTVALTVAVDGVPLVDESGNEAYVYWLDQATGDYNSRVVNGPSGTLTLPVGMYSLWLYIYNLDEGRTDHVALLSDCAQVE